MGASETSIYPDHDILLFDSVHVRTFNGVWPVRGDVPAGAVVIWVKQNATDGEPTDKQTQDVVLSGSGVAVDSAKSDALYWMEV